MPTPPGGSTSTQSANRASGPDPAGRRPVFGLALGVGCAAERTRREPLAALQQIHDRGLDLAVIGEAAELLLREHGPAVEGDLEHTATAVHEL